ncbi:MAG: polygalacturonase [Kiritimatiellae bacterium]|nr:polygalacturonase [Kiritimatiellia bacterium]
MSHYNILEFGAKGDGETVNTQAIQRAIDECHSNGGGQVTFPSGKFLSGNLTLRSNIELHLETGAKLIASTSHEDFKVLPTPAKRSFCDRGGFYALLYAEGESNITLSGTGTIDGQGAEQKARPGKHKRLDQNGRPRNILFISCKELLIKEVTLKNSGCWNLHYLDCEDVVVKNIKVFNHSNHNNDGIDIDSCRRVSITDSFIDSDDDGICLKTNTNDPCEDISVSNCVVASKCNAIKLGTDSMGDFRNININNCVVKSSEDRGKGAFGSPEGGWAGINICIMDGGTSENISISDIDINGPFVPLFIRLGQRGHTPRPNDKVKKKGKIRKLQISNIKCKATSNWGCAIMGCKDSLIEEVTISDINFDLPGGCKTINSSVPEGLDFYPQPDRWKTLPAFGFFIRHARDITFNNITLENRKPDCRESFWLENTDNVKIDNVIQQVNSQPNHKT